ncbi:MAG: HIT family protein [Acidobacteriaceae bacterium]|nr:HIT family protein [Acidobacteriaceae bacterium]
MASAQPNCIFCEIIAGQIPAFIVHQDADFVAFLDRHPLFPGHVLLSPRNHYETLLDLPADLNGAAMANTQLLAKAVESCMEAHGTFIAVNNRVSQTVPHLHIHIVPRRRKDGLKGFFWPRQDYKDDSDRESVRAAIASEVKRLSTDYNSPVDSSTL